MQHISVLNKLMYSLAVAPILTGCAIEGAASSNDEASIGQDVADGSGEGSSATPPDILDPQTAGDTLITAIQVIPDKVTEVHHVIVFKPTSPEAQAAAEQKQHQSTEILLH